MALLSEAQETITFVHIMASCNWSKRSNMAVKPKKVLMKVYRLDVGLPPKYGVFGFLDGGFGGMRIVSSNIKISCPMIIVRPGLFFFLACEGTDPSSLFAEEDSEDI
jgi:hypothetical protein